MLCGCAAPATQIHPQSRANTTVPAALDKDLRHADFSNIPLVEAIDRLRRESGANLVVNWRALETAGIDMSAEVNVKLHDLKISRVLSIILDDVGGGTVKLGYVIDDGIVTISTLDDLASKQTKTTRVYDIRDLLAELALSDDIPMLGIAPTTAPTTESLESRKALRLDALAYLVQETIEPGSYVPPYGIQEISGQLIVTATPDDQQKVAFLLDQLRRNLASQKVHR